MTQDQKIIRAKVGLLELAKQLGNAEHRRRYLGFQLLYRSIPDQLICHT